MSTYRPDEHPRSATGQFETKGPAAEAEVDLGAEPDPDPTGKWARLESEDYRDSENTLSQQADRAMEIVEQVEADHSAVLVARSGLAARAAYPGSYGIRVERTDPGTEHEQLYAIDVVDAQHRSVIDDADWSDVRDYIDLSGIRPHYNLAHLAEGEESDVLSFDRATTYREMVARARFAEAIAADGDAS